VPCSSEESSHQSSGEIQQMKVEKDKVRADEAHGNAIGITGCIDALVSPLHAKEVQTA
jgi:hypothetical protein